MKLDIKKLPRKIGEFNLFKKVDKGCKIYSFSSKNKSLVILTELEDFEIEKDFCIDEQTMEVIKELDGEIIVNQDIVVKAGRKKFKGKLIDVPFLIPQLNYDKKITTNIEYVKNASNYVSTNTQKAVLLGVNINANGNIYSTDSFFAYRHLESQEEDSNESIIVPKEFITLISSEFNSEITINYNNNSCMIEKDNIKYISNLICGSYPQMARLFKENGKKLEFSKNELVDNLNFAKKVGYDKNADNSFITCCLSTDNFQAYGLNDFENELINFSDKIDYKIYLSMKMLETVTKSIKGKNINLYYEDGIKPLKVVEENDTYLLLPIKKE